MKIALYIEDGLEQIVLTPETDAEKGILGKLHDGKREFDIRKGRFFLNQLAYVVNDRSGQESTMLVLTQLRKEALGDE